MGRRGKGSVGREGKGSVERGRKDKRSVEEEKERKGRDGKRIE